MDVAQAQAIPVGEPVRFAKILSMELSDGTELGLPPVGLVTDADVTITIERDCSLQVSGVVDQVFVPPTSRHKTHAVGVLLVESGSDCHGLVTERIIHAFAESDLAEHRFRLIQPN
jgi:hypothetical protein